MSWTSNSLWATSSAPHPALSLGIPRLVYLGEDAASRLTAASLFGDDEILGEDLVWLRGFDPESLAPLWGDGLIGETRVLFPPDLTPWWAQVALLSWGAEPCAVCSRTSLWLGAKPLAPSLDDVIDVGSVPGLGASRFATGQEVLEPARGYASLDLRRTSPSVRALAERHVRHLARRVDGLWVAG